MKKYIRLFAGFAFAVLVFGRIGYVLAANYDGNQAMNGFYQMEKNTVDVVFYGSSHIYAGVNVASLWEEYGIAGYDLAGTMQTLWNSYYNMEETLKYQSPKVMVVDVYGALIEDEYYTSSNVIKNVSSMRFSWNKIKNVWNSVPHEEFLSYMLSYPLTHDSYEELQKGNYLRETDQIGGEWYKGFKPSFAVTRYDKLPEVEDGLERRTPSEKNIAYLEKMVSFARKHQIQLVLVTVPYAGWQADEEAVYCWIEDFAKENDVPFINGNRNMEGMGFAPETDFAEDSHLNYSGACKFTTYLGERLRTDYGLEDRRGEAAYDSWQKYSDCWAACLKNMDLAQITDAEEYIKALQSNEDYVIFVSVDDKYKNNPYADLLTELSGASPYEFENGGTLVIESGKLLYRTPDAPEYLWYMETDSTDIAVVRNYGESMGVWVNNIKQNDNYNDVTILVYDKKLDMVADLAAYNSDGIMIR